MSNIPRARAILRYALAEEVSLFETRKAIRLALALMTRKRAEFRARDDAKRMTAADKARARNMRNRGWSIRRIAGKLGTNMGRVSDAVRPGA